MKRLGAILLMLLVGCGYSVILTPGPKGPPGANGHNALVALVAGASSCSAGGTTILAGLDVNDSYTLQAAEVSSSAEICNGTAGQNAPPTPFTPVALVNPCGDAPGIYDEIFVRLQNGTLIASFSDSASGNNTRFSILTAGTYQTTDGDHCVFTLDAAGNITSENHHY